MGNHSYQASSILGGVSLQEYSLRLDSQAFLQENCMLSPRYGLCKRPGSQWLANVGHINDTLTPPAGTLDYLYSLLDYKLITLYSGYSEYVAVLSSGAQVYVKDTDGEAYQTVYWPKVGPTYIGDDTYYNTPSWSHYMSSGFGPISEDTVSHTTVGDVTFINNSNIQPEMVVGSEWLGYNEDIYLEDPWEVGQATAGHRHGDDKLQIIRRNINVSNDDVFAIWIKKASTGDKDLYSVTVKFSVHDPTAGSIYPSGEKSYTAEAVAPDNVTQPDDHLEMGEIDAVNRDYVAIATVLAAGLNYESWLRMQDLIFDPAGDPTNNDTQRLGFLVQATNLIENDPVDWGAGLDGWPDDPLDPDGLETGPSSVWWDTTGAATGNNVGNANIFEYEGQGAALYGPRNAVIRDTDLWSENIRSATSVILGRYCGVNGEQGYDDGSATQNAGRNNTVWPLISVSSGNEGDQRNVGVCWKTVESIADLPPRTWEDHTVEISAEKDSDDVFYMRYVNDGTPSINITEGMTTMGGSQDGGTGLTFDHDGSHEDYYAGSGFYPSTKLPRIGHWEEYCNIGIKQELNASTMPHLLIKRDGFKQHIGYQANHGELYDDDPVSYPESFVACPAGGAFQANKVYNTINFLNHRPDEAGNSVGNGDTSCGPNGELHITGAIKMTLDPGFTATVQGEFGTCTTTSGSAGCTSGTYSYDKFPLIPGDSIRFGSVPRTDIQQDSTEQALGKLGYKLDTDYYILCIHPIDRGDGAYINECIVMLGLSPGWDTEPINHVPNMTPSGGAGAVAQIDVVCDVFVTTYEKFGWANRVAGDEDSNPEPDFLSRPIQSLSVYQDRLVLATDSTITVSGTGDYFNFFRTTVRDLIDSDPFSLVPASDEGAVINHCVPYKGNLVVFTNNEQHVIRGSDGAFAPSTAEILPATKSTVDFFVKPQAVGDELFFPHVTSSGTDLWRFHASAQYRGQYETTDISEQVPGYIPKSIYRLTGSSKHKMLFALCTAGATDYLNTGTGLAPGADQELYVYNWAQGADGSQIQSAWTKWKFSKTWDEVSPRQPNDFKIRSMVMGVDRLYLLTQSWYKYEDPGVPEESHTYPVKCQFNIEYIDLDLDATDTLLYDNLEKNFKNILIDRKTLGWSHTIEDSTSPISAVWDEDEQITTLTLPWVVTGPHPTSPGSGTYPNLFGDPENFIDPGSAWDFSYNCSGLPNTDTAPNGALTADTITSGTDSPYFDGVVQEVNHGVISGNNPFTFSVYVKKQSAATKALFDFYLYNVGDGTQEQVTFSVNLATGTVHSFSAPWSGGEEGSHEDVYPESGVTISEDGDYWRVSYTLRDYEEQSTHIRLRILPHPQGSGEPARSLVIWGAQLINHYLIQPYEGSIDPEEGVGQVHDLVVVLPNGKVFISNTYAGPNSILQYPPTIDDDQPTDGDIDKNTIRYEKVVIPGVNLTQLDPSGTSFFWVGLSYNMKSSFGPFVPKIGDKPIRGRNIFMRGARLTYSQAYQYKIEQTNGGTDYSQLVDAGRRVLFDGVIDEPNLGNGELYFGLRQFMPDLSYTLINDTPWNALFQGIMYDMNVQEIKPEYSRGMKGR